VLPNAEIEDQFVDLQKFLISNTLDNIETAPEHCLEIVF
jgi:hypothetical protein